MIEYAFLELFFRKFIYMFMLKTMKESLLEFNSDLRRYLYN